ncbi:MAG: sigma-70 family RNA polymerase sigma factor [Bacteroidetes bacterium]|nr:sigma-70 family RNA polymerase sigma factor [Bacteroidota bacterium]MCB0841995.1 sigma-70 family RNA polymerase sigma factor [Bacteroidota bacterium]MCB0854658.1 sigma-70 family RNA polymerase sigma factor [Bacteroidota bacterium]
MSNKKIPDSELLRMIKNGEREQETAISYLYEAYYNFVFTGSKKNKISIEEAQDVYSDAIITFRNHVLQDRYRGEAKISTYIFSIFSRRCIDVFRKNSTNIVDIEKDLPVHIEDPSFSALKSLLIDEEISHLNEYLHKLSETCRRLLLDFYYWGYSQTEIAERLQLKNPHTVAAKKYTCFQQLMKHIQKSGDER